MSDVEDQAPVETATDLYRALQDLHQRGQVTLHHDFKRLQHMDCPVAVEADGNIWAYGVLAATILALWLGGWKVALGVGAIGVVFYFTVGISYVRRRIRRRIDERALQSLDDWQRLWRFGGISLVPTGGGEPCPAPKGNWMAFVRGLRATAPAQ
ncbi:MAG TPA: hypothetical protein VL993_17175 [Stellaceae bacterium]|nr:hypothetical protein [Stellaceae bacterium]